MSSELERGPGRPAKANRVGVRLDDLLHRVDDWARRHRVTRAEAVRRLIRRGLDADDNSDS